MWRGDSTRYNFINNVYWEDEPSVLGFVVKFIIDDVSNTLEEIPGGLLRRPTDDFSAYKYLMNNNEPELAGILSNFIFELNNIQTNSPWFFQSVDGLGALLELDYKNSSRIGAEPKEITFKTLAGMGHVCKQLKDMIRSIYINEQYMRLNLPDNMMNFDVWIEVYEMKDVIEASLDNGTGGIQDLNQDPFNILHNELVLDFRDNLPYTIIMCKSCKFKVDPAPFLSSIDNKEGTEVDEEELKIIVDNVEFSADYRKKTSVSSYFKRDATSNPIQYMYDKTIDPKNANPDNKRGHGELDIDIDITNLNNMSLSAAFHYIADEIFKRGDNNFVYKYGKDESNLVSQLAKTIEDWGSSKARQIMENPRLVGEITNENMIPPEPPSNVGNIELANEDFNLETYQSELVNEKFDLTVEQSTIVDEKFDLSINQSELTDEKFDLSINQSKLANEEFDLSTNSSDISDEEFDLTIDQSTITDEKFDLSTNPSDISDEEFDLTIDQSAITDETFDLSVKQSPITDEKFNLDTDTSAIVDEEFDLSTNPSNIVNEEFDLRVDQSTIVDEEFDLRTNESTIVDEKFDLDTRQSDIVNEEFDLRTNESTIVDEKFDLDTRQSELVDEKFDLTVRNSVIQDEEFDLRTKESAIVDEKFDLKTNTSQINDIIFDESVTQTQIKDIEFDTTETHTAISDIKFDTDVKQSALVDEKFDTDVTLSEIQDVKMDENYVPSSINDEDFGTEKSTDVKYIDTVDMSEGELSPLAMEKLFGDEDLTNTFFGEKIELDENYKPKKLNKDELKHNGTARKK